MFIWFIICEVWQKDCLALITLHHHHHHNIFPSFPSFRVWHALLLQPMDLGAWISVCGWILRLTPWFLANWGQRSKVKVKYPWKYAFYGPFLVTGAICGTIQNQGGSGGVLLAVCQLILATCQKLENDRRRPLDGFPSIGKLPAWLARCQKW